MSRHPHTITGLLSSCALAGCGGGAATVASAPPPAATAPAPAPAPAPASSVAVAVETIPAPATRPATYDTIALVDLSRGGSRVAAPSDVRITAYQSTQSPHDVSYTVQFAEPDLPRGLSSLSATVPGRSYDAGADGSAGYYRDPNRGQYAIRFGQTFSATLVNSDGSRRTLIDERYTSATPDQTTTSVEGLPFYHNAQFEVGLSHVSLGWWAWGLVDARPPNGSGNLVESGMVRFIYGDRTPPSAVPTSGTASYTAVTAASTEGTSGTITVHEALRFALVADFGARSMSTRISQEPAQDVDPGDQSSGATVFTTPGLELSGTGALASSGSFRIPLSGTISGADPSRLPPDAGAGPVAVSGALDGAFFGPGAEQVGGVFSVGQAPGTSLYSDAFVGARD